MIKKIKLKVNIPGCKTTVFSSITVKRVPANIQFGVDPLLLCEEILVLMKKKKEGK